MSKYDVKLRDIILNGVLVTKHGETVAAHTRDGDFAEVRAGAKDDRITVCIYLYLYFTQVSGFDFLFFLSCRWRAPRVRGVGRGQGVLGCEEKESHRLDSEIRM